MLCEIKVPEAGFGIAEATIVEWFKCIGDAVEEGEPIVAVKPRRSMLKSPHRVAGF